MKVPNPLKWGFDPRKNPFHPILSTEKGRLFWGLLKAGHLTDQYFNDDCLRLLPLLHDRLGSKIWDGKSLYRLAADYGFRGFGVKHDPESPGNYWIMTVPDLEFWNDMYDALMGKLEITMEYPKD